MAMLKADRAFMEAEVKACAEGTPWRVWEYWYSPGWAGGKHGASRRLSPEHRITFVRRKLAAQADRRERAWFKVAEALDNASDPSQRCYEEDLLSVAMYGFTRRYERRMEARVKSLWRLYDAIGGEEY